MINIVYIFPVIFWSLTHIRVWWFNTITVSKMYLQGFHDDMYEKYSYDNLLIFPNKCNFRCTIHRITSRKYSNEFHVPFLFHNIWKLTFTTYETSWYSKTHFYKIFNISPWVLCWEMTRPVIIFIESCIFTLFTTNRQQYTHSFFPFPHV